MIRSIAKTMAYTKAPKTTFAVLHPRKAVRLQKMKYDLRHAYAPRVTAVGAAALALSLGYLLGRGGSKGNGRVEEMRPR